MILAHQFASRPDPFVRNRTRPSRLDSGWVCTIWSRPSLKEHNQIGCESQIKYIYILHNLARFWLHAGHNHNWPHLKHLWIWSSMFTGTPHPISAISGYTTFHCGSNSWKLLGFFWLAAHNADASTNDTEAVWMMTELLCVHSRHDQCLHAGFVCDTGISNKLSGE